METDKFFKYKIEIYELFSYKKIKVQDAVYIR